jgi:hypothetical protein
LAICKWLHPQLQILPDILFTDEAQFCGEGITNFVGMVLPTQRSHNLGHRKIHTRQYNVIFNTDIQLTSGMECQGTF